MYEVFLDTETTGLSFREGHKIVEIACIETKDLIPTGNVFHKLIRKQKDGRLQLQGCKGNIADATGCRFRAYSCDCGLLGRGNPVVVVMRKTATMRAGALRERWIADSLRSSRGQGERNRGRKRFD